MSNDSSTFESIHFIFYKELSNGFEENFYALQYKIFYKELTFIIIILKII